MQDRLLFTHTTGVHAKNHVGRAKPDEGAPKGNHADPCPNLVTHHGPDDQCQANHDTDHTVCTTDICFHHSDLQEAEKNKGRAPRRNGITPGGWASIRVLLLAMLAQIWLASLAVADSGDAFLAARSAWASGDQKTFLREAARIPDGDVLAPYIAYWNVARNLDDDGKIADFLAGHSGTWLAEKLRGDWLKDLGKRELWPAYLAEFPRLERPDTTHLCYERRAELASGDKSHLKDAVSMWFTGEDMPSACTPLFTWLLDQGFVTEEGIWRRLRMALEQGNTGVAKSLLGVIPESRRPDANWIDRIKKQPDDFLLKQTIDWSVRPQRELGIFAIDRLARTDTKAAASALESALPQLPEAAKQYAWGLLAAQAARQHQPQALTWFENGGEIVLTDYQREWWVRAALRDGNWSAVQRAINGMSAEVRGRPAWRYWLGRALKESGQRLPANQVFVSLSRGNDYYGLLSQEELGPVMGAQSINIKVSNDEIDTVSRDPGIQRAITLYNLGLRMEATLEWKWAIRNFNDRQLLSAAELARSNDWYDQAINTAERTQEQHNFDLRFISPYREIASKEAESQGIDEAWVFGLIRQESRFVSVARSGVGAKGLMQIMPATGRWIAKKLGIKRFNVNDLNEPATNLKFGTYYLRQMQDSLDGHPVLATAAYNAGPRRAQRWRDTRAMEGAVYIESIPFSETREYVKKVMTNAMFYALRFGRPSILLSEHLGTIPALPAPLPPADENDKSPSLEGSDADN